VGLARPSRNVVQISRPPGQRQAASVHPGRPVDLPDAGGIWNNEGRAVRGRRLAGRSGQARIAKETVMTWDWVIPAAFGAGFVILWLVLLPRLPGGRSGSGGCPAAPSARRGPGTGRATARRTTA